MLTGCDDPWTDRTNLVRIHLTGFRRPSGELYPGIRLAHDNRLWRSSSGAAALTLAGPGSGRLLQSRGLRSPLVANPSIKAKVNAQVKLASQLRSHAGEWVAVKGAGVVATDRTLAGLRVKVTNKKIDRVFRVPRHKARVLV